MENKLTDQLPDFKQVLTDKLKTEFINLIPEEKLNTFISDTIKRFEDEEMEKLAMQVLREVAKEKLKEYLTNASWMQMDSEGNKQVLNPEIERMMIDVAPKMFAEMMRNAITNAFNSTSNYIY